MHHFNYQDNKLYCENVPISAVAETVGTPFYLYSHSTLEDHFKVFDGAFEKVPHIVCFALKSNSNLAIISLFAQMGGGADIVSGGELFRAVTAGVNPNRIVYSGVGKSPDEIRYALKEGILMFNVESPQELTVINEVAGRARKKAGVAFRVNPNVDPKTHPYISTGLRKNKFGIDIADAPAEYARAAGLKNIKVTGISCHIGSQITEISPFIDALRKVKGLVSDLRANGIGIEYLDLGGGLGIRYNQEEPPHPSVYAKALIDEVKGLGVSIILEPGRVMVGNAGILVTKVLYTKTNLDKTFFVVDAGMNDLARPSLYNSYHAIWPAENKYSAKRVKADVVGPICESGDFLAKDRDLPELLQGDLIAVMSAGAYGFSMSSNYNSRPRVAEILVKDSGFYIIRNRENYRSLIRGEIIPPIAREYMNCTKTSSSAK